MLLPPRTVVKGKTSHEDRYRRLRMEAANSFDRGNITLLSAPLHCAGIIILICGKFSTSYLYIAPDSPRRQS